MSKLKREDRNCTSCFETFIVLSQPTNETNATICPFCGGEVSSDDEDDE